MKDEQRYQNLAKERESQGDNVYLWAKDRLKVFRDDSLDGPLTGKVEAVFLIHRVKVGEEKNLPIFVLSLRDKEH